jgi:DNA repair exonuclease SbcCD ATPase subunit
MAPPNNWKQVQNGVKPKVLCSKTGCRGSCPLAVVLRSNKADGIPAKCQVCDKKFPVPANAKALQQGNDKGASKSGEKDLQALVCQLQAEVKSLKAQGTTSFDTPASAGAGDANAMSATDKIEAAALQKQIQQINDMDSTLRDLLCESKGGYEAFVAQLQQKRQQIFAKHRSALPIELQKSKSEAHLRNVQRSKDEADAKLAELQEQQLVLQAMVERQSVLVANADSKVQSAKNELATITQQAAAGALAEVLGASPPQDVGRPTALTASVVKDYFQKLPERVVVHPEGQQTIQQVMVLLEKLDTAAAAAESAEQSPSLPAADGHNMVVDDFLDDDIFSQMAEAAVDLEADSRVAKVAEAKARLKAKGKDIEKGLANKVRKHLGKM